VTDSSTHGSGDPNVWLLPNMGGVDMYEPMTAYLSREDAEAERDEVYELTPVEYAPASRAKEYRDIVVAVVTALHNGSFACEHTSDQMLRDVPKEVEGYCAMLREERAAREREVEALRRALSFYADEKNWQAFAADGRLCVFARRSDFTYGAAHDEGGAVARGALALIPIRPTPIALAPMQSADEGRST